MGQIITYMEMLSPRSPRQIDDPAEALWQQPVVSGWLQRKGHSFPYQWRWRYVSFDGGLRVLRLYTSEPTGETPAEALVEVAEVPQPLLRDRVGFNVVSTTSSPNRRLSPQERRMATVMRNRGNLLLRASSEQERQRWIRAFEDYFASY